MHIPGQNTQAAGQRLSTLKCNNSWDYAKLTQRSLMHSVWIKKEGTRGAEYFLPYCEALEYLCGSICGRFASGHPWPMQSLMEHICTVSTCIEMYLHDCGYVCAYSNTLQVPMQPTGLSGRPLNPSFLLKARKRYACRKTNTHTLYRDIN